MIIFTYPGQGSQAPGMGAAWQEHPSWELVAEASEITGRDLSHLLVSADADVLRQTRNSQLATFLTSLIALDALALVGISPSAHAGHSLGEYSALAASGALSFADATSLVAERGEAMQTSSEEQEGAMSAVLGLADEEVDAACEETQGDVWVANYNSVGQVVIAGAPERVAAAGDAAKARGAKRVMSLPVGGAFHTPFMGSASDRLSKAIDKVEFREPDFPVYANVDAAAHTNPAEWPDLLSRQLCSPVRWCQQMQQIIADGGSTFVEIGPGKALTAMIKRIDKSKETYCINTPDDIDVLLKSLGTSDLALGEHLYVHERIVVSPAAGIFAASEDIRAGHDISVGSVIGKVGDQEVYSPFAGQIMGFLAHDTERVFANQPLAWLRTEEPQQ